jgi:ribosomal protein S6--L-glutamate ligase
MSDRPHPVLAETLKLLADRHRVRVLEMPELAEGDLHRELSSPADVYLLKSRSPRALDLARELEGRGAAVINSAAATAACRDRALLAERLVQAGLDGPRTQAAASLRRLQESPHQGGIRFPAMVKSRYSRRGDLVRRLEDVAELAGVESDWADEPVVLQEFVEGDGWDVKLWVIGSDVHSALRQTPLVTGATGTAKQNVPLPGELPEEWRDIALRVGRAFGLELFGVDLLPVGEAALVVDVNAFPGFRGVPGAPEALAAVVDRRAVAEEVAG